MKIEHLEIKLLKRLSIWTLKPPTVKPCSGEGMSQIPKASVTVVERSGTELMTAELGQKGTYPGNKSLNGSRAGVRGGAGFQSSTGYLWGCQRCFSWSQGVR